MKWTCICAEKGDAVHLLKQTHRHSHKLTKQPNEHTPHIHGHSRTQPDTPKLHPVRVCVWVWRGVCVWVRVGCACVMKENEERPTAKTPAPYQINMSFLNSKKVNAIKFDWIEVIFNDISIKLNHLKDFFDKKLCPEYQVSERGQNRILSVNQGLPKSKHRKSRPPERGGV